MRGKAEARAAARALLGWDLGRQSEGMGVQVERKESSSLPSCVVGDGEADTKVCESAGTKTQFAYLTPIH